MMIQNMKKSVLLLAVSLLGACAITSNANETSIEKAASFSTNRLAQVETKKFNTTSTKDPVIALLSKRQAWCLLPEAERLQVDTILQAQSNNASILQRIILSSCAPETNAQQSQALLKSVDRQQLSEAERSLLMLIDATNRSLIHAQKERDTLSSKLRQTIDGISDIETQINKSAAPQPRGQQ